MNEVTAYLNVIVPGSEQPPGTVPDVIPDPLVFPPVTGALLSTPYNSTRIVLSGLPFAVPISIVGGRFSLNDGPYGVSPALAGNQDSLAVQVLTSVLPATPATASVTVGATTVDFTVTTGN